MHSAGASKNFEVAFNLLAERRSMPGWLARSVLLHRAVLVRGPLSV
jgi:hypothetical protein